MAEGGLIALVVKAKHDFPFPDGFQEEIERCPVTREWKTFTAEQLEIRRHGAKQQCKRYAAVDHTLTVEFCELYKTYPMSGFYHYKHEDSTIDTRRWYRIYGFGETVSRQKVALVVSIGLRGIQKSHVLLKNLQQVDKWSEESLNLMRLCPDAGWFVDPLGFDPIIGAVHASEGTDD